MADEGKKRPLAATAFTPLDENSERRGFRISPLYLGLGVLVAIAAGVFTYLLVARAVVFSIEPAEATLSVSGLSFHIGNNFLLLPGQHGVQAEAAGYHDLDTTIEVSRERTQEVELALEPLPGKLQVNSPLDEIEVLVDGQAAGTAPGLIEDIPRGSHIVEFRKYRYFPHSRNLDIVGLGQTQEVEVQLDPAWGLMQIHSEPAGAEVLVDGQPAGVTPLTAEVLETGTQLTLSRTGFKTWERQVSVKAGTEETYPVIELVVADGTIDVSTTPAGAHVNVDGGYRGTTPMRVEISPLRDHQLELYLEGYRKTVRTVRTEPEAHANLAVDLVPVIGRIQLTVMPEDAEIIVDGRVVGTGSRTLSLTARDHSLAVRKGGYETVAQTITPREGRDQSIDVRLMTHEEAYWATRPPQIRTGVGGTLKLFRPATTFKLGAARREPGRRANEAERNVRLERPFYLGVHEITNAEFRAFRGGHHSGAMRGQTLDMDDQPVVAVSWNDAALFCNWLSRRDGLPPFYLESGGQVTGWDPDSHGYRLPTEAEWSYGARVAEDGSSRMYPWDSEVYPPPAVVGNYADQQAADLVTFVLSGYDDGFAVTAQVGSFPPNDKGLYDMSGNVSEWINDYFEIRPNRGEPLLDPTGPESGDRFVIRGASWSLASRSELRLAYRNTGRDGNLATGFRIARYVDKAMAEP